MKLYWTGQSWQLPGQQDKGAEKVDIPTAAPDLCAFLNERRVPLTPPGEPDDEPAPPPPAAPPPMAIQRDERRNLTADDIERFILNEASVKQVENIFACIGTRFKEMAKERA